MCTVPYRGHWARTYITFSVDDLLPPRHREPTQSMGNMIDDHHANLEIKQILIFNSDK